MTDAILSVQNLKVHFDISSGFFRRQPRSVKAVDGVYFDLNKGETLAVVGESGCGKSTLGRAILQLLPNTDGQVIWMGKNISEFSQSELRPLRKEMQIIFQDPLASLDPRMTIGDIIGEPLRIHYPDLSKNEIRDQVREMMDTVGLLPRMINRYPHEFSGGQCQRIGIARAMIVKPKLIVCDEPVSALDVSIQAQIINLLENLQKKFGLSLLFISHDLSIVRHVSHRVMVLYLGHVVEIASKEELYSNPQHPYTKALISAVPIPDPRRKVASERTILQGDLPSPISPPSGCVFRTRCPNATNVCAQQLPILQSIASHHQVACLHVDHL
ncbi:ABC transporter ATP-binding protein [Celerinatantimonas yamalensis]|uniref:Dipeptide ABC transporter ATP-binding protein n=1 Tax=Celerinatantimonas yamalensis TaxID=559956 RepID=A0ABW9GAD5_9GAMM